jgi:hypothetical protein
MSQDKTGSNYAANYHVPINREWLDVVIPAKNEIIYSTNMNIQYKIQSVEDLKGLKHPVATGAIVGGIGGAASAVLGNLIINKMNYVRGDYNTDVLITHEGIALNLPSFELNKRGKLKKLPPNPQYVLWRRISFSKNGTLRIESVFNCELNKKWDPEFETEEEFINRRESFYEIVTNLRSSYTAECLKSARSSLDLNDNRKALEWIERGFNSNVYLSELDYCDELNSLNAQIVKEESENKLKMVEEIDQFLVKYFQSNTGKAFTAESIMKRLVVELDNREWLEYLVINIEGELNRLTYNGAIKSNQHQGRIFFFS